MLHCSSCNQKIWLQQSDPRNPNNPTRSFTPLLAAKAQKTLVKAGKQNSHAFSHKRFCKLCSCPNTPYIPVHALFYGAPVTSPGKTKRKNRKKPVAKKAMPFSFNVISLYRATEDSKSPGTKHCLDVQNRGEQQLPKKPVSRMNILETPFWDYGQGALQQTGNTVLSLSGCPDAEDIKERNTTMLPWSPRFSQRAVDSRMKLRAPRWETLSSFSHEDAFDSVQLPGSPEKKDAYTDISRRAEIPLDPEKPLWNIFYYDNLQQGSLILVRCHHSITDGLNALQMVRIYSDQSPDYSAELNKIRRSEKAMERLQRRAKTTKEKDPEKSFSMLRPFLSGIDLIREKNTPLWPDPITEKRRIGTVSLSLSLLRKLRSTTNTSITALYHTITSMALAELYADLPDEFPVSLPMSTRHLYPQFSPLEMNSRQVSAPVSWPMQLAPRARLAEVHARISKQAVNRKEFLRMSQIAAKIPRPIMLQVIKRKMRQSNLIISSCPGPKKRLSLVGAPIEDIFLNTSLVPCNPVALVACTYVDRLSIGITSDPNRAPWAGALPEALSAALKELANSFSVRA